MKLLGAKEFLRTAKPGTMFAEFFFHDEGEGEGESGRRIIEEFEKGEDILGKHFHEFLLFGDNGASLAFEDCLESEPYVIDGVSYDCLYYFDYNVVGDALPWKTLYLVFDSEDEWPDAIPVSDGERILRKDDVRRISKWFVETHGPFDDESSPGAWALKSLEEDDDPIVNYKGERE